MYLYQPAFGVRFAIPVVFAPVGQVTEVVFEHGVPAEVVLSRASKPAVGVRTSLAGPLEIRVLSGLPSDESGRVRWDDVGRGEYVFVVRDEEYWPTRKRIQLDGSGPVEIELFKLCSVSFAVSGEGVGASDVTIDARRIGGETPLSDFVASGAVIASTASMSTGSDGVLTLEGVAEDATGGRRRVPRESPSGACSISNPAERTSRTSYSDPRHPYRTNLRERNSNVCDAWLLTRETRSAGSSAIPRSTLGYRPVRGAPRALPGPARARPGTSAGRALSRRDIDVAIVDVVLESRHVAPEKRAVVVD